MPSLSRTSPSFPTYLVQPFRYGARKLSSARKTPDRGSLSPYGATGDTSQPVDLPSNRSSLFQCSRCLTDLIFSDQIISKGFTGRWGQAYLVAPTLSPVASSPARECSLPNTTLHEPVRRELSTGPHTVSDMSCLHCGRTLGWKYVAAQDDTQKYKVGKFVLEANRVCKVSSLAHPTRQDHGPGTDASEEVVTDPPIEFDSQDEDECDDLFAGIWTPQRAARRRRARLGDTT